MPGDCTQDTRPDLELGVVVSFDRSSYSAFVPAFDLTMTAESLVALRLQVAEAVMRELASSSSECPSLHWRYEPRAERNSGRPVEFPAQRDPSEPALTTGPRKASFTQMMADRKFNELRRRGRSNNG